ncbi:MAG TPA: RraA family protein [Candidatus Lokiarchaeia archaeon]|nr:RraA family protein [Candidatus Lokiarchaeia archaeon]
MQLKLKEIKVLVAEFERLYTCAVSDAIDDLGLPPGFIDAGIRPVWPGARFVGFATTMKMVLSDSPLESDIVARLAKFMTDAPKLPVACVDMSGQMIAAGLGQSTSRMLQAFGFRGAIVDGPVRDIPQVTALKFPLFSRGIICSSIRGRMVVDLDSVNQPVKCGERTINLGDLIFADVNGVVIIPRESIEVVLAKAKEMIATDTWWFEQLEAGRNPAEIEQEKPLP